MSRVDFRGDSQMYTQDAFLCTCGPCKRFYKSRFGKQSENLLTKSADERAKDTASLYRQDGLLKPGDRVLVWEKYRGVVRYIGILNENDIAPEVYIGVQLDDNIGSTHNGVAVNGKRYFHCPRGHGALVRYCDVRQCVPPDRTPAIGGNYMFPSWEEVNKKRMERKYLSKQYTSDGGAASDELRVAELKQTLKDKPDLSKPKKSGKRVIFDPNDMVVRDAQRREMEERRRRMLLAQQGRMSPRQRRLTQLRDEWGGDERADRMIQSLQKLRLAYEAGREASPEQDDLFSDQEDDTQ